MALKYGIITIHGIGQGDPSCGPKRLIQLTQRLIPEVELHHAPALWWGPVQSMQDDLYRLVQKDLPYPRLRRWFTGSVGDAIAYSDGSPTYNHIHETIHRCKKRIEEEVGCSPQMILGHSLGSVIASDYIWDNQPEIKSLVTLGSPIAAWASRFENFGEPVQVPNWLNIYHRMDILSSPLSTIGGKYKYIQDAAARIFRVTPFVHTEYWGSNHVAKLLAEAIRASLD